MRRIVRIVLGWFFIVLGIVGLFLPVLQGILFLCIGVLLLAEDMPFFQRMIDKVEQKWPRSRGAIEKARGWLGHRKVQPEAEADCAGGKGER